MKANEIRQKFTSYFENQSHQKIDSASLVPVNDPTLLFTNAGMVPFKDYFTGAAKAENPRAVSIQKCVRAGGKHNDLENVGFTARHHTFFEMLGNFSFGDYFKKDAIRFAWSFLTEELKIPKDKLYVTVHHTDDEAAEIWMNQEKVAKDRIFYRGDKDNFWEMGEVGPCGPCSEIFYDHGEENGDPKADTSECILEDESRYVEVWNLVFMQYERFKKDGEVKQRPLPRPSVDTGAGLERLAACLQGTYNNFDTDVFSKIIEQIESISGKKYADHRNWMQVVADHSRSTSMLLADGVIPSNEGRGYVLRRIIRRAVRYLDLLGVSETTLFKLVDTVFDSFGDEYVESRKNKDFVEKYLKIEEEAFRKTLSSGLKLLEKEIAQLNKAKKKALSGKTAFMLYDTHGFPLDLTEMILRESGIQIDEDGFNAEMKQQKERSKKSGDFSVKTSLSKDFYQIKEKNGESEFCGYTETTLTSKLIGKVVDGDIAFLVFDKTPFYPEGGGQAGDSGEIELGSAKVKVWDTTKPVDGVIAHLIKDGIDAFEVGQNYILKINVAARELTKRNHTATHLLQAALIKVLGSHVKQAGSSVGEDRLRFDFTHPEAVSQEELLRVEALVNQEVQKGTAVSPQIMSKDEAVAKGAMALFGEKYGDEVRVIDIPGFSIELCGGTHVSETNEIGLFKIVSEGSLSSGVRRIEAVTSVGAFSFVEEKLKVLNQIEQMVKSKDAALVKAVQQLQDSLSKANKEKQSLKEKIQSLSAKDQFKDVVQSSKGGVYKHISAQDGDDIRKLGDLFIDKFPDGTVLITSKKGDKLSVLLKTYKGNKDVNCSDILKSTLADFGGRGGGKPDMAQGSISSDNEEPLVTAVTGLFT